MLLNNKTPDVKQMNNTLDIKNKVEHIINIKGFVPALCQSLSGIAHSDGAITMEEYAMIVAAAKKMANLSDNPALVNIFTLQGILNDTKLELSLKLLSKHSHNIPEINKTIILDAARPLIMAQLNPDNILSALSKALGIKEHSPAPSALSHLTLDPLKKATQQLNNLLFTNNRLSKIKSFAYRFNETQLIGRLKDLQNDHSDSNLDALNKQLENSKQNVLQTTHNFKQQMELLCQQNSSADQLTVLAEALYEQVEHRLIEIKDRAELQKQMFKEDLNEFIDQSVNEVELNLRQQLERNDWTKPEVWENFAKTEAAKALSKHHKKLQNRYEQIFSQWNKEFSNFSKELLLSQKIILQGLEKQELSQLIQPPSTRLKALQKIDAASSLIVNTLKMAGAGSLTIGGIAIATGVPASIFLVSATTIGSFLISSPLGWAALGTITLAGLYQYISNPTARKGKEIKNKRSLIEEGLKKLIGHPEESHNQHMDYIVENFHKTAEKNFVPLLQDTSLAVKMNKMQIEVINKINQSTTQEIEQL